MRRTDKLNDPVDWTSNRSALEFARVYNSGGWRIVIKSGELDDLRSLGYRFNLLEETGLIRLKYGEPNETDDREVKSMVLTPDGERQLLEMRNLDPHRKIGKVFVSILISVLTALITTILTLWLLGVGA